MSTPDLAGMYAIWRANTLAAEPFLDGLTCVTLQMQLLRHGQAIGRSLGSALQRITYHYWFHIGETIRQTQNPDVCPNMWATSKG